MPCNRVRCCKVSAFHRNKQAFGRLFAYEFHNWLYFKRSQKPYVRKINFIAFSGKSSVFSRLGNTVKDIRKNILPHPASASEKMCVRCGRSGRPTQIRHGGQVRKHPPPRPDYHPFGKSRQVMSEPCLFHSTKHAFRNLVFHSMTVTRKDSQGSTQT